MSAISLYRLHFPQNGLHEEACNNIGKRKDTTTFQTSSSTSRTAGCANAETFLSRSDRDNHTVTGWHPVTLAFPHAPVKARITPADDVLARVQ